MKAVIDTHPDDLRRKLAVLEGDHKAFHESSRAVITANRERIERLQKENKVMTAKVVFYKTPRKSKADDVPMEGDITPKMIERFDQKVCESLKRLNLLIGKSNRLKKELAKNEMQLMTLENDHAAVEANKATSTVAQDRRALENSLDKVRIKAQEAEHIHKTYNIIIEKLTQDRLHFDNRIAELEELFKLHEDELIELQAMKADALLSRDSARAELSKQEKINHDGKHEREKNRNELRQIAEERKRQYEAMEKRMNKVTVVDDKNKGKDKLDGELKVKLDEYEDAMRRIQDATGVTDVQDVVQRFLVQGETQAHLKKLEQENTDSLQKLRIECDSIQKEYEKLKYSGEAKNTQNQRMVGEFESRLKEAEEKLHAARSDESRTSKALQGSSAGVDHLMDKILGLKAVKYRNASTVHEKNY